MVDLSVYLCHQIWLGELSPELALAHYWAGLMADKLAVLSAALLGL